MVLAKKWERPWRGYITNGRIRLDNRATSHNEALSWLGWLPEEIRELVGTLLEVTCAADDAHFNDPMLAHDVQNARALLAKWERRGKAMEAVARHEQKERERAEQASEEEGAAECETEDEGEGEA